VFVEHSGHHRAHRDDALAVLARRLQRLLHQDGRQPPAAELVVDLGVVEDALIIAVRDGGVANGFAFDGDGVLALLGGDRGRCAGLIGSYSRVPSYPAAGARLMRLRDGLPAPVGAA
jgi:hypothetical protein